MIIGEKMRKKPGFATVANEVMQEIKVIPEFMNEDSFLVIYKRRIVDIYGPAAVQKIMENIRSDEITTQDIIDEILDNFENRLRRAYEKDGIPGVKKLLKPIYK